MLDFRPSLRASLLATDPRLLEIETEIQKDPDNVRLYWARTIRRREIDKICLSLRKTIISTILPTASVLVDLPSVQQNLLFQVYNTRGLIYAGPVLARVSSTFWITATIDVPKVIADAECQMKWMLQVYPDHDTFIINPDDVGVLSLYDSSESERTQLAILEADLFD